MTTETARPKQPAQPADSATDPDLFGDLWDKTLNMQRQWMSFWTRPFGTTAPDQMWDQWHKINAECLDFNGHATEMTSQFMTDQVKLAREFSDKAFGMTRDVGRREPAEVTPEFTREWLDTARRGAKRAFTFGNDSIKAFEDFGLKVSETMTRTPVEAK